MKKILIADDEQNIRELILETLSDLKDNNEIEFFVATNGQEAIALAQTHQPDIALLDIMMPFFSGYEVCEKIKAADNGKKTFVIMLSARESTLTKKTCERVGADLHFAKPFDPEKLLMEVQKILHGN